ncbi:hypothetical protein Tco_0066485 [Tanacetum coccineum]
MGWVEVDAGLRCYSSSPFTTRIKKRGGNTSRKGKEIRYELPECTPTKDDTLRCSSSTPISKKVDEFPAATPTKEHQVVVTNYKRAIVNGKAKMVEVVAPVQENVDVGIKQEDRRRKNVLGSMAPANFVKNPVVSASMGQGSSVKVQDFNYLGNMYFLRKTKLDVVFYGDYDGESCSMLDALYSTAYRSGTD